MDLPSDLKELARLRTLASLGILDTPREPCFDDLANLAASVCDTPMALINFLAAERLWAKANIGIEIKECRREDSLCNEVLKTEAAVISEDSSIDPRFHDNPFVHVEGGIRFYVGYPLVCRGEIVGTLCVVDTQPRRLSSRQLGALEALARQANDQLELRLAMQELSLFRDHLQRENESYTNLVRHLKESIFQTDAEGRWTFLSPSWKEMMGFEVADSTGKRITDFIHPEDRAETMRMFASLMQRNIGSLRHQLRYVNKSGETVWVEVHVQLNTDKFGVIQGTTGLITDVTERRRSEANGLSGRLQVIHSARMGALGEMAAGLAHEINNPLAIIRGTAQMFVKSAEKNEVTPELAKESARRIESTVMRIARVIASLRSFARDGQNDPFSSTKLSKIVDDAVILSQSRFMNGGARLEVEAFDAELTLECRDFQISQVLVSLLNNAYDAIATESEKVVKLRVRDLGPYAEIRVIDTGAGVLPEMREKIMEPFYTTKSVGLGMGLGLSLAKGLVEAHNGLLLCEDDEGHTCFTVTLPKRQVESDAA